MSFYDELQQQEARRAVKPAFAPELYVTSVIEAIKFACKVGFKNKKAVKGYLYKNWSSDSEMRKYDCSVVSDLPKRIVKSEYGGEFYYPFDPNAYWNGPVFDIDDRTISMIKSEFQNLGLPGSSIRFDRVEIEKGRPRFMHKIAYQKTGIFGYVIFVDVNW